MKREIRTVVYDEDLRMEAYHFQGIAQPFPNHFHEHYVVGFVEQGRRILSCRDKEYVIDKGNVLLFNPGDSHGCIQDDGMALDYRGFNIGTEVMLDLAKEVTGKRELPGFSENAVLDEEAACYLRPLHDMVMKKTDGFEKEEMLLFLISHLIQNYGQPFVNCIPQCRGEIQRACEYMEQHFAQHICLDQLCCYTGLGKSTLLRAFVKSKGVTPYRYLETVRINEAKKLLSQGAAPVEAAMGTGFSDQSHFTNYFSRFIGLAPGSYRDIFSDKGGRQQIKRNTNTEEEIKESGSAE